MTEQEIKKYVDNLETMTDAALIFYVKDLEDGEHKGSELLPIISAYATFDRLGKCDKDELTDEVKERVLRIGTRLNNIVALFDTINKEREN